MYVYYIINYLLLKYEDGVVYVRKFIFCFEYIVLMFCYVYILKRLFVLFVVFFRVVNNYIYLMILCVNLYIL